MKLEVKILKQYHSNLWPHAQTDDTRVMEDYQLEQLIADIGSTYVRVVRKVDDDNQREQETQPEADAGAAEEKRPRRARKQKEGQYG